MDTKAKPEDIARRGTGRREGDQRTTLVITFKQPVGYWTYIAYTWVGWPVDPKAVAKDPEDWWTKAEGHNGNGPFKISRIEENRMITFVPNPNYRGGKPKLDRIEMYFITDSAVAFEAYKKGELDIVNVAAEDRATVGADPVLSKEFLEFPATSVSYMGLHQLKPPFDNKQVGRPLPRPLTATPTPAISSRARPGPTSPGCRPACPEPTRRPCRRGMTPWPPSRP